MLPLVSGPVVRNAKRQIDDVFKERPETDIKVVGYDIRVVLDIRPDDPLTGLIVACKIVGKLGKVPLEVVLLHISIAKSDKYRCCGPRQETGVSLKTAATVPPE
jgi:hypothetical protein